MIALESVLDLIVRIVSIPYSILSSFTFSFGGVAVSLWHIAVSSMLISIVISLFVRSGKV